MTRKALLICFIIFICTFYKIAAQTEATVAIKDTQAIDFFASTYEKLNIKLWTAASEGKIHAYMDEAHKKPYTAKQVKYELGATSLKMKVQRDDNSGVLVDTIVVNLYGPEGIEPMKLLPKGPFKDYHLNEVSSFLIYRTFNSEHPYYDSLFYLDANECMSILNDTEALLLTMILEFNHHKKNSEPGSINEQEIAAFSVDFLKHIEKTMYLAAITEKQLPYKNDSFTSYFKLWELKRLGGKSIPGKNTLEPFNPDEIYGMVLSLAWTPNGLELNGKLAGMAVLYKPYFGGVSSDVAYAMFWAKMNEISLQEYKMLLGLCYNAFLMKFEFGSWKYGSKYIHGHY